MEGEERPLLGRRVAVYGGGNTAFDVARTAKRLGATDAVVVYRRTRDRMPAHDSEVEEAVQEGVAVKWLSTVKHADMGKLVIEKMELDETGFPQPTGEFEELEADALVLALGQEADLSLLDDVPGIEVRDGVVQVGPDLMTGCPGVFAGGDIVPAERTVTVGVGHGRTAARHVDAWLRGAPAEPDPVREPAAFEDLNPWYFSDAPQTVRPQLDLARRDVDVRRGDRRARRVHRAVRGAPLPVVRHVLRLRQLLRRVSRQRGGQAGARRRLRLRDRPRPLQGLRHLRAGVPGRGDPDGARGALRRRTAPV